MVAGFAFAGPDEQNIATVGTDHARSGGGVSTPT